MGKIHWKQQKEIPGTYRQHAYSDTAQFTVPFTLYSGDKRPRAELKTAMDNAVYSKSSFRTYGTSYRVMSVDWDANELTVEASTYIGD